MSGLYWFCIALMTDPDKFAWLIPFALFALTAVIALFSMVFVGLFFVIKKRLPIPNPQSLIPVILFATLWLLTEFARGHLFTGFPWNLAGYAFTIADAPLQLASVVGIYGLTFITVLFAVMCVLGKRHIALVCAIVISISGWGAYRLQQFPTEYVNGVKLRLVQANIQQHHKWDPELQMAGLREHVALTQSTGLEGITHVIWPETAVPYVVRENSTLGRRLGEVLLPNQYLLTGGLRMEPRGDDVDLYNSLMMFDSMGAMIGHYDKHGLVPFGEFLPFRFLIPKGWQTPVGDRDFARGAANVTFDWKGLPPLTPLICYEVIFPQLAFGGEKHPEMLLSVTNDAWFGESSAPYQHLAMARMRAVEQGAPMVRVANTGITAVFDSYGREINRIPLGEQGILDVGLPKKSQNDTIFRLMFN